MGLEPNSAAQAARESGHSVARPRAWIGFALAALCFLMARQVAQRSARGLASADWQPLAEQAVLVFLLLFGFAGLAFLLDRQANPVSSQGLPLRQGWRSEVGLGVAIGWAIAVVSVLAIVVSGGIAVHFTLNGWAFGWLAADAAFFALSALATQIAFRGYPFQCAIRAIGEVPASLLLALLYSLLQAWMHRGGGAAMAANVALGLLLALACLRTRALWLPWGLQFGWVASRALIFGLPVSGVSGNSPVVQGEPLAPYWISGEDFGLDGTWLTFLLLLLAMPLVYRVTRDLSFVVNAPVLKPAGIPVDLDAAAKRQHELATRPQEPEPKPLVQIQTLAARAASHEPLPSLSEANEKTSADRSATETIGESIQTD